MKDTSLQALEDNILKDIRSCSKKELNKIYDALKKALKKFDRDGFWKDCRDHFENFFKSKKQRCINFVIDIVDSKDQLMNEEKEKLRRIFLDISNIHRTFIENIVALIDAL